MTIAEDGIILLSCCFHTSATGLFVIIKVYYTKYRKLNEHYYPKPTPRTWLCHFKLTMKLHNYTYQFHPGPNKRTLLLLHGVGGDENDMTQIGQFIDPDASRISPKGKVEVDGYARYFTRLPDASFDPDEVARETDDLVRFIEDAMEEHQLTDTELVAVGYSNGANMIASMLAKHPTLIKQAILFRGMLPTPFSEHPDLSKTKVLLVNGEADHIMDKSRVAQLNTFLARQGADTTLHWSAAGHQLTAEDIAVASQWLASTS